MQNKLNLKEKKEPDSSERPNEQPWIVSNNLFIDITVISTFNSKTMIWNWCHIHKITVHQLR